VHILYVTNYYKPAYSYGGPVRSVSQLCEALVKLGVAVTVLTTNANGTDLLDVPLEQPINSDGVEVFYYPIVPIPPRSFFYSPALARACYQKADQFKIAVLDTFFTYAMGPAVAACRQAGRSYIVSLRGQLLPWSLRYKWLKKQVYLSLIGHVYLNKAAALHCTAPTEAEALAKLGIRTPKFVVPNGVDSNRFAQLPVRGNTRQRLNIRDDDRVLLFLGRLHHKKRPDLAVEALGAAQSLPARTHLVLAGPDEGQLTPKLQAQAQRLGCANRLHLTGLLQGDEILSVLADADLLLMPSAPGSENFGRSAVEALAAGVPILVSEGVPVGHWAEAAGAGRTVPCTAESFRQVACTLLARPEQLKTMGRRGQILVCQQFDSLVVARQMLAQYQSIIETGQPIQESQSEDWLNVR
jgi:glycosyltransferase involved in cell wall biosynthesis